MKHAAPLVLLAVVACDGPDAPAASPPLEPAQAHAQGEAKSAPEPEPVVEAPPEPQPVPTTAVLPDGTHAAECGDVPADMACIPGGPFLRGADDGPENTAPQTTVHLSTFLMDLYEVTNADYRACVKEKKCPRSGPRYLGFDHPKMPITGVSWYDAVAYCEAYGKRLPTEAEWEKAARGTEGNLYSWGNQPVTCERAIIMNLKGRSCGVKKERSKPDTGRPWDVGSRAPGVYGLYDMIGNSWEWVADWYEPSYTDCGDACAGLDPRGPCGDAETCPGHRRKIVRGGSWYWPAEYNTAIYRRAHVPGNDPFHHFGFRCAASIPAAQTPPEAGNNG